MLFQVLPTGGRTSAAIELPAEVRDYQLLQLEEENLQEMIHQSPEAFTLSLPGNGRSPLEVELVKANIFFELSKIPKTHSRLIDLTCNPR